VVSPPSPCDFSQVDLLYPIQVHYSTVNNSTSRPACSNKITHGRGLFTNSHTVTVRIHTFTAFLAPSARGLPARTPTW
jgi:hypothetical protein